MGCFYIRTDTMYTCPGLHQQQLEFLKAPALLRSIRQSRRWGITRCARPQHTPPPHPATPAPRNPRTPRTPRTPHPPPHPPHPPHPAASRQPTATAASSSSTPPTDATEDPSYLCPLPLPLSSPCKPTRACAGGARRPTLPRPVARRTSRMIPPAASNARAVTPPRVEYRHAQRPRTRAASSNTNTCAPRTATTLDHATRHPAPAAGLRPLCPRSSAACS
jgi:hypothetical protein